MRPALDVRRWAWSVGRKEGLVTVQSYQELEVWKVAKDLAADCYRVAQAFPKDELFGMTSQIRRSAASIPGVPVGSDPMLPLEILFDESHLTRSWG